MESKVKKCPSCKVSMKVDAKKCPACGKPMPVMTAKKSAPTPTKGKKVMSKAENAPMVKTPKAKAYDDHDWD
ncbi:hypothetical protein BH10CHL1_BH10CHL1_18010 [soil metagenome]